MWTRRTSLAAALMLWAIGAVFGVASQQAHGVGVSERHICAPSTDNSGAPPAHHHCAACLVCSFRDLAQAAVAPGAPTFTFEPRHFALVAWPADVVALEHRRDLIAQRPRAPPSFS